MRILVPVPADEIVLQTSNAVVSDYSAWSNATSYILGDRVHLVSGNRAYDYEAIVANTNTNPGTNHLSTDPKWVLLGASNRFKIIDRVISDASKSSSGNLTYRFQMTENVTSIAFFGLVGQTVTISVQSINGDGSFTTITDSTQSREIANSPNVTNWFQYFFSKFENTPDVIFDGLPAYTGNYILVSVTGAGNVAIGEIVFGEEIDIGTTLEKPTIGIRDYSRKERDEFGRPIIVERPFSLYGEFDIVYPTTSTRNLLTQLSAIRASPAVFYVPDVSPGLSTMIFGYYTDFSMNLEVSDESYASITVEGLV